MGRIAETYSEDSETYKLAADLLDANRAIEAARAAMRTASATMLVARTVIPPGGPDRQLRDAALQLDAARRALDDLRKGE